MITNEKDSKKLKLHHNKRRAEIMSRSSFSCVLYSTLLIAVVYVGIAGAVAIDRVSVSRREVLPDDLIVNNNDEDTLTSYSVSDSDDSSRFCTVINDYCIFSKDRGWIFFKITMFFNFKSNYFEFSFKIIANRP